jgi:hypothetical protein
MTERPEPDEAAWNNPDAPRPDWNTSPPPYSGPPPSYPRQPGGPVPSGPPYVPPASPPPPGPSFPGPAVGAWVPPQPAGPAVQPGAARPTNSLAIAAFVASFLCGPAGLIMGFLARQQLKQRNEGGDGLALAAIIIGAVYLLGGVLWLCLGLASSGSGGGGGTGY